jgi:hypothetical protein
MLLERHRVAREGLIGGTLGATAVAVWFLIIDSLMRYPLYTPRVLGRALFSIVGSPAADSAATHVVGYTVFHYAAFIAVGTLLAALVARAQQEPTILAALVMLFIIFQLGFYGLAMLLAEIPAFGRLAWLQVAVGNLVAAAAMGTYLWRAHPEVRAEARHAFAEE